MGKEEPLIPKRRGMIGQPWKTATPKIVVNHTLLSRITTIRRIVMLIVDVSPVLPWNNVGMIVTSTVAANLGLPSIITKSAIVMSHKVATRQAMLTSGVHLITLLTELTTAIGRISIPPGMGKPVAVLGVMFAGMTHARRMQSLTLRQDCLTSSTRNTS